MGGKVIELSWGQSSSSECLCVLIIPARAMAEPGYIKGMHYSGNVDKHEFRALAQTGYYQYQDDELEVETAGETISIRHHDEGEQVAEGLVLYRAVGGAIGAIAHESVRPAKLLETANRYCTRWVRLDI